MTDQQLLHLVFGGELKSVGGTEFKDLAKLDFVGAFPDYSSARTAWKSRAQATVDNALVRYFIVHAHRLLDPHQNAAAAPADRSAAMIGAQGILRPSCPSRQGGMERLGVERLGQKVVHAGIQAGAAVVFEGVGGQGDDRGSVSPAA